MTIQERIEAKRKELETIHADQQKLWEVFREEQDKVDKLFRDPWNDVYRKREELVTEIAILEKMAKELQPA